MYPHMKPEKNEIYILEPKKVPLINTKYRVIQTKIPVPESISILKELREVEPISMRGQPPIIWDHAENFSIYDKFGNKWIDLSSGVLVTNAGHSRKEIIDAIVSQAQKKLIHNYCFPSEIRLRASKKILEFSPNYLNKVFLLTTGSEATENALKLCRTYGHKIGGKSKNIVISFNNAFHGRTLGAQMIGGSPSLKEWIVHHDPEIINVPFPDGYYNEEISFDLFLSTLKKKNINSDNVCMVITETYQGGGADFLPKEYVQVLRKWCDDHKVLLVFDEVQAGFGRTGKKFGFMHYGVEADLVCLGKGLSSGLPASGVLGRKEILDLYPPGSMTSTHTGNPIILAAVIENIELIEKENLVKNAEKMGKIMHKRLQEIVDKYDNVGVCHGKGLVGALQIVKDAKTPDKELATSICQRIIEKGVMMFSPVGKASLKISPPLTITEEAILEALDVIDEAIQEILDEIKTKKK
jgi:4-aminobutyrate aminotransferase / (S)-3-amino-2-methylpropionate transaminase / 5-aminovalerate transaminase